MPLPRITYSVPFKVYNSGFELGKDSNNLSPGWNMQNGWYPAQQADILNHLGVYNTWFMERHNTDGSSSVVTEAEKFLCSPGQVLTASAWVTRNGNPSDGYVAVRLGFLDASFNGISNPEGSHIPASALNFNWLQSTLTAAAPAGTVYGYVEVANIGSTSGFVEVDDVTVTGAFQNECLMFKYPPNKNPLLQKTANRTDTFSTSGVRQTVQTWTPQSIPINMQLITKGDDADAWQKFLDYAVDGSPFTYYPDADNEQLSFPCFLQDTAVKLTYSSPGAFSFAGTFQVEVFG